jgi:thioredoxin reductase
MIWAVMFAVAQEQPRMEKQKILILGGGDIGIGKAVAALTKDLEKVMIVDKPSNVFEVKIPEVYGERIDIGAVAKNHEYGWYRRFEKNSKKRNFKKAT